MRPYSYRGKHCSAIIFLFSAHLGQSWPTVRASVPFVGPNYAQTANLHATATFLGLIFSHLGRILAPSFPILAPSWPILAPSWLHLGPPSWPHLGPSWPHLGPSWPILAPSCPILAASWPHLGPSLLHLVGVLPRPFHLLSYLCPTSCPTSAIPLSCPFLSGLGHILAPSRWYRSSAIRFCCFCPVQLCQTSCPTSACQRFQPGFVRHFSVHLGPIIRDLPLSLLVSEHEEYCLQ